MKAQTERIERALARLLRTLTEARRSLCKAPEFTREPHTTGDPQEDAETAAFKTQGTGMESDVNALQPGDLAGFTLHARNRSRGA